MMLHTPTKLALDGRVPDLQELSPTVQKICIKEWKSHESQRGNPDLLPPSDWGLQNLRLLRLLVLENFEAKQNGGVFHQNHMVQHILELEHAEQSFAGSNSRPARLSVNIAKACTAPLCKVRKKINVHRASSKSFFFCWWTMQKLPCNFPEYSKNQLSCIDAVILVLHFLPVHDVALQLITYVSASELLAWEVLEPFICFNI